MKPFSILDLAMNKHERRRLKYVGIKKTLKPSAKFTSLERKYYSMLKELDVYYVPQYPMGNRFYDAFLPDHNILFEFDGSFWHPLNESDCKYGFQKKSMRVDEMKNKMANDKGIRIIRIREESPITTDEMRKLIWQN